MQMPSGTDHIKPARSERDHFYICSQKKKDPFYIKGGQRGKKMRVTKEVFPGHLLSFLGK